MKILLSSIALLAALQDSDANAQFVAPPPMSSAFGTDPTIRISATFRTALAATDSQSVPDATAQETARRALYAMAAKECDVLSETFKAQCRLGNVMIFSQAGLPSAPVQNVMAATANDELRVGTAPR